MTMPAFNRKDYRASACIDWLDVMVSLNNPSQHRHIRARLKAITGRNIHAYPLGKGAGGNATRFKLRFHDDWANDLLALTTALDQLNTTHPFSSTPTIRAIEVACDFYWQGADNTQLDGLSAMTHRLQQGLFVPNAINPRQWVPNGQIRDDGKPDGANRSLDFELTDHNDQGAGNRLDPCHNFRIGNRWSDVGWQVYLKVVNDNGLPITDRSQWRARVEATIRGDALQQYGLCKLSDLDGYGFDQLMPLFKFRRPTDLNEVYADDPARRLWAKKLRSVVDATAERGIHSFEGIGRRDKRDRTRAESKHLIADPVLAGMCKGALRRLNVGSSAKKMGQVLSANNMATE